MSDTNIHIVDYSQEIREISPPVTPCIVNGCEHGTYRWVLFRCHRERKCIPLCFDCFYHRYREFPNKDGYMKKWVELNVNDNGKMLYPVDYVFDSMDRVCKVRKWKYLFKESNVSVLKEGWIE